MNGQIVNGNIPTDPRIIRAIASESALHRAVMAYQDIAGVAPFPPALRAAILAALQDPPTATP